MHVWGSPISFLANLNFAMAFQEIDYFEFPIVYYDFLKEFYTKYIKISDGKISFIKPFEGIGIKMTNKYLSKKFKFIKGSGFKINA